jgi:hypothetical protein
VGAREKEGGETVEEEEDRASVALSSAQLSSAQEGKGTRNGVCCAVWGSKDSQIPEIKTLSSSTRDFTKPRTTNTPNHFFEAPINGRLTLMAHTTNLFFFFYSRAHACACAAWNMMCSMRRAYMRYMRTRDICICMYCISIRGLCQLS